MAPVRDGAGALLSLEFLNPEGGKTFLKEGAVAGGHHGLGDPAGARAILVCEGYATGASLHEACGLPVAVAFGAGNLFPVASDLQRRYPEATLVIAGDDDRHTPGNPGRRHAEEAARRVNGAAILPDFAGLDTASRPTDFNDLRVLGGLAHLRRQLESQLAAVLPAAAARPVPAMAVLEELAAPARRHKTHRDDGGRPNLYREVTDRIVEMIEAGTAPWQRPWDRARHPGAPAFPVNAATGHTYRGVNVLLLGADPRTADDPRWCGYEQAKARGWQVRAGARGATIYFFKRLAIPAAGEADAEPPPDEDGRPLGRTVPLLRRHTVFHAAQIEGIPALEEAYGPAAAVPDHVWAAEDRLERLLHRSGARIVHGRGGPYYDPVEDCIALPPRQRFPSAAAFFGVAFHELAHWAGHETRLNRPFARRRDAPEYAREELRAELASAFLGAELGIRHDLASHAAYLDAYLELLRQDHREIFRAARDAQAIADLILDRHPIWQLKDGVCARRTEPPAAVSAEAAPAAGPGGRAAHRNGRTRRDRQRDRSAARPPPRSPRRTAGRSRPWPTRRPLPATTRSMGSSAAATPPCRRPRLLAPGTRRNARRSGRTLAPSARRIIPERRKTMLTRRRLLQTTAGLLAGAALPLWPSRAGASGDADPPGPAAPPSPSATFPERTLWLHRVQTREEGRALYFMDHALVPDGYSLLCYLLRDVRADRVTRVDVKLIHLLFGMQAWLRAVGIRQPLRVDSGYRTPETNADTEGAAVHSRHLAGRAADFAVAGIPSAVLAKLALRFDAGGVGVYPTFVHVDTGPVRTWAG